MAMGGSLIVPVNALVSLVTLLRLEREGCGGAGLQSLQGDRIAGLFAIAVGALVDARDGGLDLCDQLALAVAGAKLDGPVGFGRCAVGKIRMVLIFALKSRKSLLRLLEYFSLPTDELTPEVFPCRSFMKGSSSVGR